MKQIDIIIFAGQSNMQGQSETLLDSDVVENAYEYKWLEDDMVPLQNPVGENVKYDRTRGFTFTQNIDLEEWLSVHLLGASCYGHTNMVPEFCKVYLSNSKEPTEVLAIHVAKGSTQIKEWLPGTEGYQAILEKSLAGISCAKKEYEINRIFFVWFQGASDALAGVCKESYKEKLTLLNDSLKSDLKIEKFGIIRVGRFTNDDRDLEIIYAQSEICRENRDFLMLTEIATELQENPEYMNPYVSGHYSAKGLNKLGAEAGKSLSMYRNHRSDFGKC